jgi:hypothetical protein
MAGTVPDLNTLDERPLLCDVLAFIAEFCKSPQVAEEVAEDLILDYLHKSPPAYDCLYPEGANGRGISPRIWGTLSPSLGLYCPIDFDRNTVTLIRLPPEAGHGSEAAVALKALRKYSRSGELFPPLGFPYQLRFVRLHRDVVVVILRSAGFLLPEPVQPVASIPELESPESQQQPEAIPEQSQLEAIPKQQSETIPEQQQPEVRRASIKHQMTCNIIARRFPNGTDSIGTSDVLHQVESDWADECKARNVTYPAPRWGMVNAILGRSRPRRRR